MPSNLITPLFLSCATLFFLGCAQELEHPDEIEAISSQEVEHKRGAALKLGGEPGSQCSAACIWSPYAVAYGAQDATHDCDGQACACVIDGDIFDPCAADITETPGPADQDPMAGESCGSGCIWSSYAVSIGAQSGEVRCGSNRCSCVVNGDVYAACAPGVEAPRASPPEPPTTVPEPRPRQPRGQVPYFYQYANRYSPSATCQNTALAMVLRYSGWRGTPDEITAEFGRAYAQSPEGLADVFNTLARRAGITTTMTAHRQGVPRDLKALLDSGKPVITHGYFTRYGHVLVLTGYDSEGYYVNDPAGAWTERFKGGYSGRYDATVGRSIYYSKASLEAAINTSNGWSTLPIWYHELR